MALLFYTPWHIQCIQHSSALIDSEAKHTLSVNLISVQPCAGREIKKREKVENIIFREIKVPGNIPVIQYWKG